MEDVGVNPPSEVNLSSPSRSRRAGGFLQWVISQSIRFKQRWKPSTLYLSLVLTGLTILGALPRLYALGSAPLWNDEAQTSLAALQALATGNPVTYQFPITLRLVNLQILYPEIESWSFHLFGVNAFSARFPSAILGVLTIPLAFLLGRKLRDAYVGLALATMVAFSSEYIAWSRQARFYALITVLFILLILVALYFPVNSSRLRWVSVGGIVSLLALSFLATAGLFFLYLPAFAIGGVTWWMVRSWNRILAFFGKGPLPTPDEKAIGGRILPYPLRTALIVGLVASIVLLVVFPPVGAQRVFYDVFTRVFPFQPYPLVYSPNYLSYLLNYYSLISFLAIVGTLFVLTRFRETEVGIVAFVGMSLLSLSVLQSLVNDAAGGLAVFERHLVPLLVFIFYLASVALVEVLRLLHRSLKATVGTATIRTRSAPVAVTLAVALLLIIPPNMVPSDLTVYRSPQFFYADSAVPWVPFSVDPMYPSALYNNIQPNYLLSCNFIKANERVGDVVAAYFPGVPTFYLGHVNYWMNPDPSPHQITFRPNGLEEFMFTTSILVQNVSEFETVIRANAGWMILEKVVARSLGTNLTLALSTFGVYQPEGSDQSIELFHWPKLDNASMLTWMEGVRPDLQRKFGDNVTALRDWAATYGVTVDHFRPLLLPIESWLVSASAPSIRPLAVLLDLYNVRSDLQYHYPEVLHGTFTGLVNWAVAVDEGIISDPAYAQLHPYLSWYAAYHGP